MMADDLKLIIVAEQLPVPVLAKMLSDLDTSFKQFVRRHEGRASKVELAVSAVDRRCIEIVLDAIDAVNNLAAARQYLAPFATHLAQLVEWAINMEIHKPEREVVPADLKALRSLTAPVAKGAAMQINIVNNGDMVVNINGGNADSILKGIEAPEADTRPVRHVAPPLVSKGQIAELIDGKLTGSAFLVDRKWYAQLEGGRGVLVPITASNQVAATLEHGVAYAFRGRPIHGARGETVGIAVEDAERIGGGTDH